jgi:L-ascorbate metabolism protein UlaG (beta-lactamase superfamily)
MEFKYHGHSCFQITEGDTCLLVDPFLAPNNPAAEATAEDVDATHIAVSHGHADHVADAVAVSKRTGAPVVAMVEVAGWMDTHGAAEVRDPNLGGTVSFDWGWIKLVPAWHTNTMPGGGDNPFSAETGVPVGVPAGLVISIGGKTIYYTGDTCLFSDMKLVAERHPVDVAVMPIGGHYTMDRHDAVVAAKFIGAETVIPVHYNTFPAVETDAAAFKADVEAQTDSKVAVLDPGQSLTL